MAGFVAACVIGAILLVTGAASFGGGGVNGDPVEMPESLGGYSTQHLASEQAAGEGGVPEGFVERMDNSIRLTGEHYANAHDGAGVGVQGYADDDLAFLPVVVAIRDDAPGLTVGVVSDPADLGLAVPQREVIEVDGVECVIFRTLNTVEGAEEDPEDRTTPVCQRSEDGFTVMVHGPTARGQDGQDRMVDLTNAAFDELSG